MLLPLQHLVLLFRCFFAFLSHALPIGDSAALFAAVETGPPELPLFCLLVEQRVPQHVFLPPDRNSLAVLLPRRQSGERSKATLEVLHELFLLVAEAPHQRQALLTLDVCRAAGIQFLGFLLPVKTLLGLPETAEPVFAPYSLTLHKGRSCGLLLPHPVHKRQKPCERERSFGFDFLTTNPLVKLDAHDPREVGIEGLEEVMKGLGAYTAALTQMFCAASPQ